jgi:anti-sigma B factor antagonist
MSDMNLAVESRESGDWIIVEARGEVDLYTAPRLKEELSELVARGRNRLVVNLEGIEFLDSTGLGVLIGALRRCRESDGALVLAAPTDAVRKVLRITGLDQVFPINDTVDQALGT